MVSEKLAKAFKRRNLKGILFEPVIFKTSVSNYYQLIPSAPLLTLNRNTIAGGDPFDTSNDNTPGGEFTIQGYKVKYEPEVHKCPLGHTIGTNLLSEVHILGSTFSNNYDFYASKQKIGVRRGVLRQHPVYLCSPAFRKMVIEEKLTGFDFEVAYIDKGDTLLN